YTADAQFSFDSEQIEGDSAEVQTHIKTPARDKPFSIVYRLHQKNGEWLVYDVVAENISMVRNYRNQFSRIMNDASYEELERAIKEKLTEKGTAPSPQAS
ncbi:MAG: MlaC/ttg2D family ABC transporter substrate-binding protein, partial [Terriglobia bacterium]